MEDNHLFTNHDKHNLSDSVVLITGALTGIGRATAFAFAKQGAKLVVSGRKDDAGKELENQLHDLGVEAIFVKADVRKERDVQTLVDTAIKYFGRLDIAVNNAGTEGQRGMVIDKTPESYAATFDTNVLGTLLSMKHEMKAMLAKDKGSIVNISSTLGQRGTAGASIYVASKHAIDGLTKSAALEGALSGIRVNSISPGPTDTSMLSRFTETDERKQKLVEGVPMHRMGLPEEVAEAIVFIGSDAASFITGRLLAVDGGKLAADK